MKDWTGNRRSAHAMIGSFVGAHNTREEHVIMLQIHVR